MKAIPTLTTILTTLGLACAEVGKPHSPGPAPEEQGRIRILPVPQEANPGFTTDLYAQLRATEGNVFFSPLGISQAMGMAYTGARGNTATEIATAMSFAGEPSEIAMQMAMLRDVLQAAGNRGDNQLNIANALCVTRRMPDRAYLDTVGQRYEAKVFKGGLAEINGWVKEKTGGHIDKILEELDPDSMCVLLNAVYFKGKWANSFQAAKTHQDKFHVSAGKQVDAQFMSRTGGYRMVSNEEWIAVELPYETSASMVLVIPAKADGMGALEASLDEARLKQLHGQLGEENGGLKRIELVMPKFKIATSYNLISPMRQLGIKDAFTMAANFSGMYDDNSAYITQIVHKATLEVDEQGSVATAATAVEMSRKSAPRPAPQVRFDRPFLVLIRESKTQSTLFMGRISDPTAP